jgi:hypothetical protein
MAPKTQYSIPLNKTMAAAVPNERGRRTTQTTESIPLHRVARRAATSVRRPCEPEGKASGPSEMTMETYPLQFTEPASDESDEEPDVIADKDQVSNVSSRCSCYSGMVCS